MDEIAGAAGVSKKTLYKLFENKGALFRAVLEGNLQKIEFSEDLPTSCSGRQTLRLALQRVVGIVFDADEVALHRLLIAERRQSPSLIEIFSDVIFERGADGVVSGLKKVRLRPGIDKLPEALVADMLLGAVLGKEHFRSLVDESYKVDRQEMDQRIDAAIGLFCVADVSSLDSESFDEGCGIVANVTAERNSHTSVNQKTEATG